MVSKEVFTMIKTKLISTVIGAAVIIAAASTAVGLAVSNNHPEKVVDSSKIVHVSSATSAVSSSSHASGSKESSSIKSESTKEESQVVPKKKVKSDENSVSYDSNGCPTSEGVTSTGITYYTTTNVVNSTASLIDGNKPTPSTPAKISSETSSHQTSNSSSADDSSSK